LIQVCGALAEAHRRGLIHRDIKPANIILSERGDVPDVAKVVDFGLVKELAATDQPTARGVMGTPSYVAPETITDPDKIGPSVDLYALGAVGFYLLTGQRVFQGKTSVEICVQHVTAAAPRASSLVALPRELDDILLCCLAKRPEKRPSSAAELAHLLRTVPLGTAWTEPTALGWWREFRAASAKLATSNDSSTRSITVSLGDRSDLVARLSA
jgi:eukaryotic-like serine/threonine-protein kinase